MSPHARSCRTLLRIRQRYFTLLPLIPLFLAAPIASGATETWNGATTDWNTAANWSPAVIPNSTSTPVIFSDTDAGSVNISSSVSILSLTFTNSLNDHYTLTSSAGQILTVQNAITMAAGVSALDTINLANITSGSLLYSIAAPLVITNNSTTGGTLVIGQNTVLGTAGSPGVTFSGPGAIEFSGSIAASPNNIVGPFLKTGPGPMTFSGNGTNLTGSTILNGGSLDLDYFGNGASKSSGNLTLDDGIFQLSNGVTPASQAYTATTVNAGQTDIKAAGAAAITLTLNTISRNAAGTVDFNPTASNPTFSIQTSTGNTNSLLGAGPAYATVNGGTNWAAQSGVVIAPLSGFSINIFISGANTDVTASALQSNITTNSLRFNTGNQTLTFSGTNTIQSGGILITPNASGGMITGGTLTSSTPGSELIFHVYDANGLTVNSNLTIGAAGLTKTGPGTLTLGGSNNIAGPINVNRGGLAIANASALNGATQINFNDDRPFFGFGGLQKFTADLGNGTNANITAPVRLSAFSASDYGTYFSTGNSTNSTVTLSGILSSSPGLTTPIRFTGPVNDSSGFNLTNSNTFTGDINLLSGSFGINSDASLGNAANNLHLAVGNVLAGGLLFLNSGINVTHGVVMDADTRVVSNGADVNTISSPISGNGGLAKDGSGTLLLTNPSNTYSGTTFVSAGVLSLGSTGSLNFDANLTIGPGATFTPGTTGLSLAVLTLQGGTFRVSGGSGNGFLATQITVSSGGAIDFSGAGADQLVLEGNININSNSTWLSPNNGTILVGDNGTQVAVNILPGSTLTNGIALQILFGLGFRISGGGTLYQNSDATNLLNMSAPIIVTASSTFRVTDASSNGGVGNLGSGNFTLDGATFSYGGITATTQKPIALTTNGGTIQIESPSTALTSIGAVTGPGILTKTGPGTLIFTNGLNSFSSLIINGGTVQVANDAFLGAGPITVNPGATLLYSVPTSTSRTFTLNSGTLQVAGGQTLTLNGASVNGGFMRGKFILTNGTSISGATTFNSSNITQSGPASLTNFINGGTLTNNANLTFSAVTNASSGIINVNSNLSTQDFTSDGVINIATGANLTNVGSNLVLGGGSRTFIGANNAFGGTLTVFNGTLEVNGALLVNDGTISGTTNVNYGGTAQGIGNYGPVNVSFGGTFQPGFASAALPNNSATITQLSGNGTIDNTSSGNMTLTLAGNSTSSFSGPIQNSNGTTALSITGTGSLTLSTTPLPGGGNSINTYSGGTTISVGASVIIAASGALPSGQPITNNGNFTVNANSTAGQLSGLGTTTLGNNTTLSLAQNTGASKQGQLILNPNAQLNLTTNPLIIEAPDAITKAAYMSQLAAEIATARNNGLWNGPGITSSTVAANPSQLAIAIADNAILNRTSIGGQSLDSNSIIILPDYFGDANLDGTVNAADLNIILQNFGANTPAWTSGNFDGAPTINLTDLADVLNNFGLTNPNASSSQSPTTPTPEPASLTLLFPLLLRSRHRNKR